ncbi:MAG: hypothetical protein LEGION0398_MBIBDBAK_00817 [Legionellaceae bacterium]
MIKQKGFILLTILIFIILTSIISFHLLEDSLIQKKMNNNFYSYHQNFAIMEIALREAEKIIEQTGSITENLTNTNVKDTILKQKPLFILQNIPIQYSSQIIQRVCYKENDQTYVIDFFRITVNALSDKNPIQLQSTYARKSDQKYPDCIEKKTAYAGKTIVETIT